MDYDNPDNKVALLEQQLHLMVEANHRLNQELSLEVICKTLVEYGLKLVNASAGGAGILIDGQMHFDHYYQAGRWQPIDYSFKPGEGVPGWVTERLIPYISHDAINDPEVIPEIQQALGFVTLITIPIIDNHGLLIGCLELHNKANEGKFNQHDIEILEGLSASAAVAINNARIVARQQQSQERFVLSQRFANIGTWDWNIQSGELFWSEQIAPLFGYAVGELETTYDNFLGAVHEEDRQSVVDAVNACVERDLPYEIEHRVVWPNGTVRWVLERGGTVKDNQGKPLHMLGVVQDITQRIELDEALRQERDFAEGMIETAQAIVLVLDTDGRIVRFNPYLEEISGYRQDEVIGSDWFEIFIPEHDQEHIRNMFKKAVNDIQTRGYINPIISKSGESHYIEWYDKTLKNSDGEVIGLLATGQDITERLDAQERLKKSEEQFRNIVENSIEWIWEIDRNGRFTYVSPQAERLLGYRVDEFIGKAMFEIMPPDEIERIGRIFQMHLSTRKPVKELEGVVLHKDGHEVLIETNATPILDGEGELTGFRGINRDITERRKAEKERRLAAMVLENTPEGVMITDSELNVISINPAFTRTTGYSAEEMIGQRPTKLSSGRHDTSFYKEMWHSIAETGRWQGEIWNRRKDGEIYPEWLNISAIKDQYGHITNYASIFSDISTQEHVRKRLHNLAYYDALTRLPNRELFHDRLENALIQSRRHHSHVGLIFLDMDRFKNINDTLGHRVGDEFLKMTAERLKQCVRDTDTVSRLGGDEFTIILPDIHSSNDVASIAEKIVNSFSAPITMENGHELFSSTSIGISIYPEDGEEADLLIKNADTAMYRAKEAGRGTYQFYTTEMSAHFSERLTIETDLRRALSDNQLTLAYQPQIDLCTGRIVGFEALARWNHPDKGPISPAQFIPVAEDSGQIEKLGEVVLLEACRQLKLWSDVHGAGWRMAVNFSGLQLRKPNVVKCINNALQQAGVTSDMLELELTESSLMENVESNIQIIDELSHSGFLLSVDDFGTGYSSLSYLKRFNIDKLKIDQSFVRDITSDHDDAEIVTTIIAMGHNLGLRVIAEGVETQEQLDFLRARGCDEIQGYLISRPKSAEEIDAMLATGELRFSNH
jgi:diguanylate cyclase (GGDEF)-like protein/PAS domain S-box-containing protein